MCNIICLLFDEMFLICRILFDVLFLERVNFLIFNSVWNVRVKVVLKRMVLYVLLYIICSFGIMIFKILNVIGSLELVYGFDFFIFCNNFWIRNDFVGFVL